MPRLATQSEKALTSALRSMMPVVIGGTHVDDQRVSGPPSRMLPALRDLGTGKIALNQAVGGPVRPVITIEIDTPVSRKVGVIHSLTTMGDECLYITPSHLLGTGRTGTGRSTPVKLANIIAFRVLNVEVEVFTVGESHAKDSDPD